jgi:hypothetical protein
VRNSGTDYTDYVNYTYRVGYWCAPGVDARRRMIVQNFTPEGNTTNPYVGFMMKWGRSNNATFNANETNSTTWRIKDIPISSDKRLMPDVQYMRHFRYLMNVSDLGNDSSLKAAITSDRRCAYNVTIGGIRYERYGQGPFT